MTTWNTGAQPVVLVDPGTGEPSIGFADKDIFYSSFSFAVAANPTTVVEIIGVAGYRIQIDDINFDGTVASSLGFDFVLNSRSVASTGGSSSNQTSVPKVPGTALPGLTIKAFTANPTPGTLVGAIARNRFTVLSSASTTYRTPRDASWGLGGVKPVLTGTSDILTIDMLTPATSPTALYVNIMYSILPNSR